MNDPARYDALQQRAKAERERLVRLDKTLQDESARTHLTGRARDHLDDVEQMWLAHASKANTARGEQRALEGAEMFLKFATEILDHTEKAIAAYGPDVLVI